MKDLQTIQVEPYLIAYLDILGYKESIEAYGQNIFLKKINEFMDEIECRLIEVNSKMQQIAQVCGVDLKKMTIGKRVFSDNILLYTKAENDCFMNVYYILGFITLCALVQQDCILRYGLLLRGSITKGDFYANNVFVFGQSLVRAYELESTVALYPRIIVDKPCMDYFLSGDFELDKLRSKTVFNDKDGIAYVNYLLAGQKSALKEILQAHREIIMEKLKTVGKLAFKQKISNDKIFYKLSWIANYHNEFCKRYTMEECCINTN